VVIEGGGRSWPGSEQGLVADWMLGPATRDIDGNQMIWDFFVALPSR
jgi:poly(3-hydroxybutyrate) depolymerase